MKPYEAKTDNGLFTEAYEEKTEKKTDKNTNALSKGGGKKK